MKEIIKVSCNEEEYNIRIEGKYIDLVSGVVHLIKAISESTETHIEIIMNYINGYLEDEDIEIEKIK